MAVAKYSARDVDIEVHDGTSTWLPVLGINSLTYNPAENEETVDATTFASDGQYEGMAMQRGASLSLEGFRLKEPAANTLDPGQARLETLAAAVGTASLGQARFKAPGDTTWVVWACYVSVGEQGGGNNDLTSWSATLTRSGAATSAAVA